MDFELAPPVRDALIRAVELGDLGYVGNVDGLLDAFAGFMQRRLGVTVGPVTLVADVMIGIQEVVRHVTSPGEGVVISPPCYPPYFAGDPARRPSHGRGAAAARTSRSTSTGSTRPSSAARACWCCATRTTRPGASRRARN